MGETFETTDYLIIIEREGKYKHNSIIKGTRSQKQAISIYNSKIDKIDINDTVIIIPMVDKEN